MWIFLAKRTRVARKSFSLWVHVVGSFPQWSSDCCLLLNNKEQMGNPSISARTLLENKFINAKLWIRRTHEVYSTNLNVSQLIENYRRWCQVCIFEGFSIFNSSKLGNSKTHGWFDQNNGELFIRSLKVSDWLILWSLSLRTMVESLYRVGKSHK